MNNVRRITASLIMALLVFAMFASAGRSQDQEKPGRRGRLSNDDPQARKDLPARSEPTPPDSPAQPDPRLQPDAQTKRGAMSADEKLVRDVYTRLMRYQSAARDELEATDGKPSEPKDYLTFELRNIRTGPIEEIYGRPLAEVVTTRAGALLSIRPVHLSEKNGPPHAYYEAEWADAPEVPENPDNLPPGRGRLRGQVKAETRGNEASAYPIDPAGPRAPQTVEEMLRRGGQRYANVERYTSYEVTAQLNGQRRTYRSLVLHFNKNGLAPRANGDLSQASAEMLDNITGEMNTVLKDESPRVRSPWNQYVKSSLYLAVARTIKETKEGGRPLIAPDAPIGYLPGDDVKVDPARLLFKVKGRLSAEATVTSVNYVEHVLAPWRNDAWGAMRPTTWTVDIDVYLDCGTDEWYAVVSKADSEYELFYRLFNGASEATAAAATQSNYCGMISDLAVLGNPTGSGWYMVSAVEAHERVHVGEWRASLDPQFTTMKNTIESLHTPASLSDASQAIAAIKAMPQYQQAVNNALSTARTNFFAIADPNPQTDAAEHAVVDPMIAAIRSKATTNNWTPCPP